MIVTLDMLRALLERALTHTDNPATLRLPEGVATAYLARKIEMMSPIGRGGWRAPWSVVGLLGESPDESGDWRLDLTDPGTAHTLLVALALALGLDPGVGGLGVRWTRFSTAWQLEADGFNRFYRFMPPTRSGDDAQGCGAPLVAAESDPVRALALAVAHVVGTP